MSDVDINEELKCMQCGKELPGRYLFCSEKCEEEFDKHAKEQEGDKC